MIVHQQNVIVIQRHQGVARKMDFFDGCQRVLLQLFERIFAQIQAGDVEAGEIQQQAAAAGTHQLGEKRALAEFFLKGEKACGIFQQDAPSQPVLHRAHVEAHLIQAFCGVRQREHLVKIVALPAIPGEVLGKLGG